MSDSPPPLRGPTRVLSEETARKWRKRRSRLRRLLRRTGDVALVALAVVAIVFAIQRWTGGGKAASTTTTTAAAGSLDARYPLRNDVALKGCTYFDGHFAAAGTMDVVNHTPQPWTYYIDVRFNDGSAKWSDVTVHTRPLSPSKHVHVVAWARSRLGKPAHLTCTITAIQRVST
jgi:hypothetical protein